MTFNDTDYMSRPNIREVISEIERFAPPSIQEEWDNSGLQVGSADAVCNGVMICVDVTPNVISEARQRGCNLVVSHHPLLFRGLKSICPDIPGVQQIVCRAIESGITVYSAHTSLDKAPEGISAHIVRRLGARPCGPLVPDSPGALTGLGCIGLFEEPLLPEAFYSRIRQAFGDTRIRHSRLDTHISRFAVCGGSGGEFIPRAVEKGCSAYLTSEIRYHDFVDYGEKIVLADIGHFESEECAKDIFYDIISEKFHNFAVWKSENERNPILYS